MSIRDVGSLIDLQILLIPNTTTGHTAMFNFKNFDVVLVIAENISHFMPEVILSRKGGTRLNEGRTRRRTRETRFVHHVQPFGSSSDIDSIVGNARMAIVNRDYLRWGGAAWSGMLTWFPAPLGLDRCQNHADLCHGCCVA